MYRLTFALTVVCRALLVSNPVISSRAPGPREVGRAEDQQFADLAGYRKVSLLEMSRAQRALVTSPTLLEVRDVKTAVRFLREVGVLLFFIIVFYCSYTT